MYGFSMIICMKDTHYKTRRRFITGVERPVQLRLQGVLIPTTAARPARQRAPDPNRWPMRSCSTTRVTGVRPRNGNEHRTVRRRDRNQRGGQRGSVEQSKTSLTTIRRNEDNKVDAFNGPTWWLADFVSSGWLEPLGLGDDHMSKFPDLLTNLVQFDGQTYMAPEFGKWGSYLYDQQYLEQQGFESPPDTWDEVLEQGEQLASDDKAGFAFTWSDKSVFTFKQFLYQAGGQLFNDSNEPTFVEEGVEVLEFFDQLRERNIIPDGMSSLSTSQSRLVRTSAC